MLEKNSYLNLPKEIDHNDVDFFNLLDAYNTRSDLKDKLDINELSDYKAIIIKNQDKEVVGGFFYTNKRSLEPEIYNKYGDRKNLYVTGMVNTYPKNQRYISMVELLIIWANRNKRSGYLVWGLVSDVGLLQIYKKRGLTILNSIINGDKYSTVVF